MLYIIPQVYNLRTFPEEVKYVFREFIAKIIIVLVTDSQL